MEEASNANNQAQAALQPKASWLTLIVLALAQFMLIVDVTIVNIALPSIQHTFSLSNANLQWIVTAYALTFGGCLLLGGRTADLLSRRMIFLIGLSVFTLASLASGLARTGQLLIIFRALQGLAGAFMSPAALSMVLVTYTGSQRNTALAIWGAVASAGGALGVLLGGVFTQYLGWQWNFFINVPIGILVFIATLAVVGKYPSETVSRSLDLVSAALVTAGLMLLVYGLTQASTYGWGDHRTFTYFIASAVSLLAFVVNENAVKEPILPLQIFRRLNLAAADSIMLIMAAGLFSSIFLATLYVQNLLGFSPIKTGLCFLIFPACVAIAATNVPRLIKNIGVRPILIGAPMLMSAGLFYESAIPVSGNFWTDVAPGMVLMALGMGAAFVSITIAATSAVTGRESGLASGLVTTSQQIGGAVGLATVTAIATTNATSYLKSLHLMAPPSRAILATATVRGFQDGYLAAGYVALAAAVLALIFIKSPRPAAVAQPSYTTGPLAEGPIARPTSS